MIMLPTYLLDSGFFEKIEQTNWLELDEYKGKEMGTLLEPQHPFKVEFIHDIVQQRSDSLDCGVYVATFTEFPSDLLVISSNCFRLDYLRNRYTSLLWRYGSDKAKGGYVGENDDPPKPKGQVTPPFEEDLVQID
ncbi:hypothetical protein KY290_036740 [Solanum tuberosum]|uniref:Ubiquitin-like protease family profile domain-containing protein n=1 Tax=Solanum tuberosum TaxID=4113 RepID=A0ABQ7TXD6_SOLTU|nr:hypothetical protein KY289_036229 [Solanum tuberosum]KAH0738035.1 hypothetical protein KY290_036740 [Solanum tuberosum]